MKKLRGLIGFGVDPDNNMTTTAIALAEDKAIMFQSDGTLLDESEDRFMTQCLNEEESEALLRILFRTVDDLRQIWAEGGSARVTIRVEKQ